MKRYALYGAGCIVAAALVLIVTDQSPDTADEGRITVDAGPVTPDLTREDSSPSPVITPLPTSDQEGTLPPAKPSKVEPANPSAPLQQAAGDEVAEIQRAQDDYVLMVQDRVKRLVEEGKVALDPADAVEATEFERKALDAYNEAWVEEDLSSEEYGLALIDLLGEERAAAYRKAAHEAGRVLAAEFYAK